MLRDATHERHDAASNEGAEGVARQIPFTPNARAASILSIAFPAMKRGLAGVAAELGVSPSLVCGWADENSDKAGGVSLKRIEQLPPAVRSIVGGLLIQGAHEEDAVREATPLAVSMELHQVVSEIGRLSEEVRTAIADEKIDSGEWARLRQVGAQAASKLFKLLWIIAKGERNAHKETT